MGIGVFTKRLQKSKNPTAIMDVITVGSKNVNGGEDRTRTCKPVKAVVFKTTALPIMLLLRIWQFRNIPQTHNFLKLKSVLSFRFGFYFVCRSPEIVLSSFEVLSHPLVFKTTLPLWSTM